MGGVIPSGQGVRSGLCSPCVILCDSDYLPEHHFHPGNRINIYYFFHLLRAVKDLRFCPIGANKLDCHSSMDAGRRLGTPV